MKKALFAGTFDPPSIGHLDIIEKAAKMVDTLVLGIAENGTKAKPMFSLEQRLNMLKAAVKHIKNVEVVSFSGLVADYVKKNKIDVLIRGLRNFSEQEMEFSMAIANRKLANVETLFLLGDEKHAHISSSIIRDIVFNGGDLTLFVPAPVEKLIKAKKK
jgi:pantetheine-phosphate adenylyltransferase